MNGPDENRAADMPAAAPDDDALDTDASAPSDPAADTSRFEKAIAGRDSLVRALRDELQRIHEEKDELEGDLHEAEEELEQKTESEDYLTGKVNELLTASEQAEEKVKVAEGRAKELEAQIASKPDMSAAEGERDALSARIADLEAARDDLAEKLSSTRAKNGELAARVSELEAAASVASNEDSADSADAGQLNATVARLEAARDEITAKLQSTESERASIAAERDKAQSDLGRHMREAVQREQELIAQIGKLQQTAESTSQATKDAGDTDEADELRKRASDAEERASYLALKLASETEVRAVLEAQRSKWVGAADSASANIRGELEPQLNAAREKLARLEARLEVSERTCEKRLGEKHVAEQRALDAENKLIGTIEALKQRAADAEKRAAMTGIRATEIEERVSAESQRAKEASNELSRLRDQSARSEADARDVADSLRKDIEALQGRALQLEEQLRDGENERSRLAEERTDLHSRFLSAEARESELKAKLKKADDLRRVALSEQGFLEKQIAELKRDKDESHKSQSAEAKKVERAEKAVAQIEQKMEATVAKYDKELVKQFDKGVKSQQATVKALEKELKQLQTALSKLEKSARPPAAKKKAKKKKA